MKRIIFGAILVLSAFLAIFSISFSLENSMKFNRLSASSSNQISDIRLRLSRLEEEDKCFVILHEHEGIIGIFDSKEKNLLGTINVSVKTLPEADRKQLLEGIVVKDANKFISLFEDYSS